MDKRGRPELPRSEAGEGWFCSSEGPTEGVQQSLKLEKPLDQPLGGPEFQASSLGHILDEP